jgi:hypothetical protein
MGLPFGSGCVAPSIVSPTGKPTTVSTFHTHHCKSCDGLADCLLQNSVDARSLKPRSHFRNLVVGGFYSEVSHA